MAENTKIAWCDHTWNPWIGCSHVHTGCENCYAERQQGRFGVHWGPKGTRRKTSDAYWKQPLKWEREAATQKALHERHPELEPWVPPKVFVGSLMDFCEDWRGPMRDHHGGVLWNNEDMPRYLTMADLRRDACWLFDRTPHVDYLLCTKRPENIQRMWPEDHWEHGPGWTHRANVWLLYSASDQATLDAGLPHLLACRDLVPVLGLSLEPLVGPVDLRAIFRTRPCDDPACDHQIRGCHNQIADKAAIDWVIVGGESGPYARPCNVADIRSVVKQCGAARAACFVKQVGTNVLDTNTTSATHFETQQCWPDGTEVDYHTIHLLDPKGGDPSEWPEDIRVRQWPGGKR